MKITQEMLDELISALPLDQVLRIVVLAPEIECPGESETFAEKEAPSGVHSTGAATPGAKQGAA